MILDINNLPSDTNILHQIVADLVIENHFLKDRNISLADQLSSLRAQLILLKKQRFGQSSEKLDLQIAELETKIEEGELLDAASDVTKTDKDNNDTETQAKVKPKNTPKRNKL